MYYARNSSQSFAGGWCNGKHLGLQNRGSGFESQSPCHFVMPHSSTWQSNALLTRWLLVRVQLGQFVRCRVDESVKSPVSETGNCRFDSYPGSFLPCGVTGNISHFDCEESRFDPWRGNVRSRGAIGRRDRLKICFAVSSSLTGSMTGCSAVW